MHTWFGDLSKNWEVARSASGSGGGQCNDKQNLLGLNIPGTQFRKYCCNGNNPNLRFADCQWFRDVGPAPDPRPNGFCRSGCPPDRVRTSFNDEFEVENPKLDAYRTAMMEWADDPTCPNPGSVFSRRAVLLGDVVANASLPMALEPRDGTAVHDITVHLMLTYILARIGSEDILEEMGRIWDNHVEENFPYLTRSQIKALLGITPQWENDGPEETARRILCSPHSYNAQVAAIQGMNGNGKARWINCTYVICDENGVCGDGDDEATRRRRGLLPGWSTHLSAHRHHLLHVRQVQDWNIEAESPDGTTVDIEYFVPDHPIDKNLMKLFFEDATMGTLRSGARAQYGPVPIKLYEFLMLIAHEDLDWLVIPNNPDYDDGNLFNRVMKCLGSKDNNMNFILTHRDLNYVKGKLMQLHDPIQKRKWEEEERDQIDYVLGILRATVGMFDYLNTDASTGPDVFGKTLQVLNDAVWQITYAENLWENKNRPSRAEFCQFLVEWLRDYYGLVTAKAQTFLRGIIPVVRDYWESQTGDEAEQVIEVIDALEPRINRLAIRTNWEIEALEGDPMDEDTDGDTDMSG
ncbi:hypothetical protein ACJ41O_007352 [Fusarium nematophilum]